jgi:MinD-like ATPase involved in chromosome partitioning or flagellar assembly
MKVALAFGNQELEREVLRFLVDQGAVVVRRCLTRSDTEDLAADVEILTDQSFMRREGVSRRHRLISGTQELAETAHGGMGAGRLVAFLGTSGGAGTTATTLYSAAQATGDVLVVDADLWHPSASLYVDGAPTESSPLISALVRERSAPLRSIAAPWQGHVWVLGGVDAPSRRGQVTEEVWLDLLARATNEFDEVRVDLGSHYADEHAVVEVTLAHAGSAVVVSHAHPASALHARAAHERMTRSVQEIIHVVNGMAPGPIGVTAYRILTSGLPGGVDVTIPRDDEAYSQAFIDGVGLCDMQRSPAHRALDLLNERLAPAPAAATRSPLGRVISIGR